MDIKIQLLKKGLLEYKNMKCVVIYENPGEIRMIDNENSMTKIDGQFYEQVRAVNLILRPVGRAAEKKEG